MSRKPGSRLVCEIQTLPGFFNHLIRLGTGQYKRRRGDDRVTHRTHDQTVVDQEIAADRTDPLCLRVSLHWVLVLNQFKCAHQADHARFADKRVLVIDGDLRRPAAHKLLQISRRRGLSDILQGRNDIPGCAVNSKIPKLTLLPAGPSVRNPLTLLTSPAFFDLLEEAKKDYDIVFIDSPPLLPVVDTKILKKIADMVLFVVRADGTPRESTKTKYVSAGWLPKE